MPVQCSTAVMTTFLHPSVLLHLHCQLLSHAQGMSELISSQSKVKYLTAAKEGKYKLFSRSTATRETEWERQVAKLQSLKDIVDRLQTDFPGREGQLRNLSLAVKSKLVYASSQQILKEAVVH